jgi:5'-AMP-activated protein kinase, regulatory gamma subunit
MFNSQSRKPRIEGVKTEFVFADGAKDDVQLSGDWNDWKAIQMFHEGGGMWSVVAPVPPGPHEFKFIVDGEWKHSNRHPTIGIDDTSLNNVRYVLPQPDLENGHVRHPGPRESDARASNARRASKATRLDSKVDGGRDSKAHDSTARRESRASNAKKALAGMFK